MPQIVGRDWPVQTTGPVKDLLRSNPIKSKREQALELLLRYHDKTQVSPLRKVRHTRFFLHS